MMPSLITLMLLMLLGAASSAATTEAISLPAISIFAGGNFGPGWWTLDIDGTGAFATARGCSPRRRRLTEQQRQALSSLVSALPRDKPSFRFLGPSYIDVTVEFRLTVGRGTEQRRYVLNDTFADYSNHPQIRDVLAAMQFLRTLCDSTEAHVPPVMDSAKRQ
jgi:hypothetical protein